MSREPRSLGAGLRSRLLSLKIHAYQRIAIRARSGCERVCGRAGRHSRQGAAVDVPRASPEAWAGLRSRRPLSLKIHAYHA